MVQTDCWQPPRELNQRLHPADFASLRSFHQQVPPAALRKATVVQSNQSNNKDTPAEKVDAICDFNPEKPCFLLPMKRPETHPDLFFLGSLRFLYYLSRIGSSLSVTASPKERGIVIGKAYPSGMPIPTRFLPSDTCIALKPKAAAPISFSMRSV